MSELLGNYAARSAMHVECGAGPDRPPTKSRERRSGTDGNCERRRLFVSGDGRYFERSYHTRFQTFDALHLLKLRGFRASKRWEVVGSRFRLYVCRLCLSRFLVDCTITIIIDGTGPMLMYDLVVFSAFGAFRACW